MMGRALMTSETRWGPPRNADGYRVVFQEHHARLVRFAYLLSGDRHAADDLAADAFARVFPHWCRGSVDDPGAYLRRTVVNLVRERARRGLVRDIRPVAEPDPGPVDAVEGRTDEQERLLAALRRLSEEQRLVIVLRIWDDLSEAETADVLGVAVGTVKSRTARALDRLRALLEEADRD
jgi:RNA polymerase sigma-70 factor (sigma-E family)